MYIGDVYECFVITFTMISNVFARIFFM